MSNVVPRVYGNGNIRGRTTCRKGSRQLRRFRLTAHPVRDPEALPNWRSKGTSLNSVGIDVGSPFSWTGPSSSHGTLRDAFPERFAIQFTQIREGVFGIAQVKGRAILCQDKISRSRCRHCSRRATPPCHTLNASALVIYNHVVRLII